MKRHGDLERRLLSLRPAAPAAELRERVLARAAAAAEAAARRAPARRDEEALGASSARAFRLAWAAALALAAAIPLADHLALRGAAGEAARRREPAGPPGALAGVADLAAQMDADEPLVRALLAGRRTTVEPNAWDRRAGAGLEDFL